MAIGLPVSLRNTRLNDIKTAIDAGAGAGKLRIFSGTRPATGGAETTKLAELTLSDPCAPDAANGVLTFSAIATGIAVAAGTATWARMVTSDGAFVVDMGCGLSGSGAEVIMESVTIAESDSVRCTSAVLTEGNA